MQKPMLFSNIFHPCLVEVLYVEPTGTDSRLSSSGKGAELTTHSLIDVLVTFLSPTHNE